LQTPTARIAGVPQTVMRRGGDTRPNRLRSFRLGGELVLWKARPY
jgi:hypothetical protein